MQQQSPEFLDFIGWIMSLPLYQYEIRKARVISFVDAVIFAAITMTSMTSAQKQPVFGAESGAGDTNSKMCEVVVVGLRLSTVWQEASCRPHNVQHWESKCNRPSQKGTEKKISRWLAVESCWKWVQQAQLPAEKRYAVLEGHGRSSENK